MPKSRAALSHAVAVAALAFSASVCVSVVSSAAVAAPRQQYDFDIPSGGLAEAVSALIRQTQISVIHPDLRDIKTQGVKGRMTPGQALKLLLEGTDLEIVSTSAGPPLSFTIDQVEPRSGGLGSAKHQPTDLGNIHITARRRVEDIQDVPMAIQILTGEELERRRLYSVSELSSVISSFGVQSTNTRSTSFSFRGLGSGPTHSDGSEVNVGVYVDGIYYARFGQLMFDLLDVSQIEFLPGPQGTFYGKNTSYGALNITTRQPTFVPEAEGEVTIGNYKLRHFKGVVSGPIIDGKLAARFMVGESDRGGFTRNLRTGERLDDHENITARGHFLFTPTEDLTVRVTADYANQDRQCCALIPAGRVTTRADGSPLPDNFDERAARLGYVLPPIDPFEREADLDGAVLNDMKHIGVSGAVDWNLGAHNLTVVSGWRSWEVQSANDSDATGLPIVTQNSQTTDLNQFTIEARLASHIDRPISYVAGLFYYHLDNDLGLSRRFGGAAPAWVLGANTAVNQAALINSGLNGTGELSLNHYAVFGQALAKVRPDLTLTLGLRYTHERKRGRYAQLQTGPSLASLDPGVALAAQAIRNSLFPALTASGKLNDDDLSGDLSLTYRANDRLTGYVSYSRGQKSPSFNMVATQSGALSRVKAETTDHFEAGVKALLFGKKAAVTAALFWTEIDDAQVALYDRAMDYDFLSTAAQVRARGIDVSLRAQPAQGLSVLAGAVYSDAEYRSYRNAPCPVEYTGLQTVCDLSGRRFHNAPKWSLTASFDYHRQTGPVVPFIGGEFNYRSAFNSVPILPAASRIKGYELVNLRLGIRDANSNRWEAFIWARNLFDKNYFSWRGEHLGSTGLVVGLPGEPRTYGLTLRLKY